MLPQFNRCFISRITVRLKLVASDVLKSTSRTMNELILFGLLTAYLVALTETSSSGPNQQVGLDVQKFGHRKHIKVSVGKQWEEREGQWSAGFYVKHSKNMPPDQPIIRDNQAGVELKGHFKG